MNVVEIGRLRNRVLWQRKSPGTQPKGRNGESTTPYQDMGTFWAALEPLRGAELYQAAQQNSTTSFRIIIRYQAVAPGDRFIFSSKVSPPRSFVVDSCYCEQEQNEYLMINATELKKA